MKCGETSVRVRVGAFFFWCVLGWVQLGWGGKIAKDDCFFISSFLFFFDGGERRKGQRLVFFGFLRVRHSSIKEGRRAGNTWESPAASRHAL